MEGAQRRIAAALAAIAAASLAPFTLLWMLADPPFLRAMFVAGFLSIGASWWWLAWVLDVDPRPVDVQGHGVAVALLSIPAAIGYAFGDVPFFGEGDGLLVLLVVGLLAHVAIAAVVLAATFDIVRARPTMVSRILSRAALVTLGSAIVIVLFSWASGGDLPGVGWFLGAGLAPALAGAAVAVALARDRPVPARGPS